MENLVVSILLTNLYSGYIYTLCGRYVFSRLYRYAVIHSIAWHKEPALCRVALQELNSFWNSTLKKNNKFLVLEKVTFNLFSLVHLGMFLKSNICHISLARVN